MGDIGFHAAGHRCIHGKPNAELPDLRRPSLSSLAADKTNITCTKVDVKYSYQISLIQIMISNLDPL